LPAYSVPVLLLVGKFLRVLGDLLGDRHKGARLLFRVEHVFRDLPCVTEKIEIFAVALGGQLLHLHAEFGAKLLQILVIGVDKLAAEFAEHALVKIVLGEHASAPTIARFKHNRLHAGGLQAIGRGQPGNATTDDGDRPLWKFLLRVGVPGQQRRQRRGTGRAGG
jgi:hypothetical protein